MLKKGGLNKTPQLFLKKGGRKFLHIATHIVITYVNMMQYKHNPNIARRCTFSYTQFTASTTVLDSSPNQWIARVDK